jgi:hypothetical protein
VNTDRMLDRTRKMLAREGVSDTDKVKLARCQLSLVILKRRWARVKNRLLTEAFAGEGEGT